MKITTENLLSRIVWNSESNNMEEEPSSKRRYTKNRVLFDKNRVQMEFQRKTKSIWPSRQKGETGITVQSIFFCVAVLHCNQNDRATRFPRTRHYGGLSFCNFLLAILFAGESTNKGTGLYRILQNKKGSRTKFIVFAENRKKCTLFSRINICKTLILFVKK